MKLGVNLRFNLASRRISIFFIAGYSGPNVTPAIREMKKKYSQRLTTHYLGLQTPETGDP
jgi:hypothetical protein